MRFNLSNCQFNGIIKDIDKYTLTKEDVSRNTVIYTPTKEALSQFIEGIPDFLFSGGRKRRDFQYGEVHLLILGERYIKTIVYIFYDDINKLSDRSKHEKIYVFKEIDQELIYDAIHKKTQQVEKGLTPFTEALTILENRDLYNLETSKNNDVEAAIDKTIYCTELIIKLLINSNLTIQQLEEMVSENKIENFKITREEK